MSGLWIKLKKCDECGEELVPGEFFPDKLGDCPKCGRIFFIDMDEIDKSLDKTLEVVE